MNELNLCSLDAKLDFYVHVIITIIVCYAEIQDNAIQDIFYEKILLWS